MASVDLSDEPYKTYQLTSIDHATKIATALPYFWFRGQPQTYGTLAPAVFRRSLHERCGPDYESQLCANFERHAPAVTDRLPGAQDHLAWLFLMQHHGTPTRLLDWSESALVGLFFAVIDNQDRDGELWAMSPQGLNLMAVNSAVILAGSGKDVEHLALQAFTPEIWWERRGVSPSSCCKMPLAIAPPSSFPRLVNQHSMFTIHPAPSYGEEITAVLGRHALARYIIPATAKRDLQHALACIGISHRTLFPDLDGLSKSLVYAERRRKEMREHNWTPPACAGAIDDKVTGPR